jgi:hypothetical protein
MLFSVVGPPDTERQTGGTRLRMSTISRRSPCAGRKSPLIRTLIVAVLISLVTSSCAIHGLSFVQDKRLSINSPASLSTVSVPFTLTWTMKDFSTGPNTIQGGNDYFAVFVDRQPMPPGAGLRSVADNACKATPGCPDRTWLQQHYIFLTSGTSLTIGSLPQLLPASSQAGTKEDHQIDIVLMNGQNRRIGESVWDVEFFRIITGFG